MNDLLVRQILHAPRHLDRQLQEVNDTELAAGLADVGAQVAVCHEGDDGHGVALQVNGDALK